MDSINKERSSMGEFRKPEKENIMWTSTPDK